MLFLDRAFPRHVVVWQHVEKHLPAGELAHDVSHIARVYRWALRLAAEGGADADDVSDLATKGCEVASERSEVFLGLDLLGAKLGHRSGDHWV